MSKCSSVFLILVQVFLLVSCQYDDGVQASSSSLIFDSQTITVNPGDRLDLQCGVQGEYRHCVWEKSNTDQSVQVKDVHEGYQRGMSKPENTMGNECGIVIDTVDQHTHGTWICKVFVRGNTLRGQKDIIVTLRPSRPIINVNENPMVVLEKEEHSVSCTVEAARPPVSFIWHIGSKDITSRSESENIAIDEFGTYRSVSTLRYAFDHTDDKQNLRCSIDHHTLTEPEFAEIAMDIRHAPYPLSKSHIYSIPIEEEYEIRYNFSANPLPQLMWRTGDAEVPVPGEVDRYVANIRQMAGNQYMATLRIREFSQHDIGTVYRLVAENDFGTKQFEVMLSTGPAPPDSMGTGTVVAIIFIVLIIIVLLLLIGVFRYRQMYCFGQKDRVKDHLKNSGSALHEEHDTESARAPEKKSTAAAYTNVLKNLSSRFKLKNTQDNLHKAEEGEVKTDKDKKKKHKKDGKDKKEKSKNDKDKKPKDKKSKSKSEVVYADLEHSSNGDRKREPQGPQQSTEYAEIVGTQTNENNDRSNE